MLVCCRTDAEHSSKGRGIEEWLAESQGWRFCKYGPSCALKGRMLGLFLSVEKVNQRPHLTGRRWSTGDTGSRFCASEAPSLFYAHHHSGVKANLAYSEKERATDLRRCGIQAAGGTMP